ncbi:head completion/stabilization protein [Endozoicomonas sp. YOMI1]|uniref:head completion/stabilization protein n=1 Tax=Endozoicomonas sp. YOMI1 TaxID=2828739 RepID=UPI002147C976|nr:head completion/stabilization protein [Endozoicomonas sp. YOMI1]
MSFSGFNDQSVEQVIQNDGFWPDLQLDTFQSQYRLPAEYEQGMVIAHVQMAIVRVNTQLIRWKALHQTQYSTMREVPADSLGAIKTTDINYQRAVFCLAKSLLLQQFATVDRRSAAANPEKEGEETASQFQEYADHAIADFLGRGRINVEAL